MLDYVPGECWPQLLASPSAAIHVEELLRAEVLGLPRPLYSQVHAFEICLSLQTHLFQNSGAEPGSYSHLTETSVLRGLVSFLQAKSQLSPHPSTTAKASPLLASIISLLAAKLGRPLPPLDWTFLDSLHESAMLRLDLVEFQSSKVRVWMLKALFINAVIIMQTCCGGASLPTSRQLSNSSCSR